MYLRPEDIESVGPFYIEGEVNGEDFTEAEFDDPVEAFREFHKPVYEGITTPKHLESGGYAEGPRNDEYDELMSQWKKNQEADLYFRMKDAADEEMRWDLFPRTDIEFAETSKPFSMMEAKYTPSKGSNYDRPQKLVLRMGRDYDDEALEAAGINTDYGRILSEIDLLTAFDREEGVQEQMDQSEFDWRRPVRHHYRVLRSDYEPDWERSSETVPLLMNFLPNELESVGISDPEKDLAARHIASCHGINLSFREDREAEELMTEFGTDKESLVNIDAELGRYIPEGGRENSYDPFDDDFELYKQQIVNLAGSNWREVDAEIEQLHDDFLKKVEEDEKNWGLVLDQELPEDWQKSMPQERFV